MACIRTAFGGCVVRNVIAPTAQVWWGASNPTGGDWHIDHGRRINGQCSDASGSGRGVDRQWDIVVGAGYAGLARRDTDNGRGRRHSVAGGEGSDWNLNSKRHDSR